MPRFYMKAWSEADHPYGEDEENGGEIRMSWVIYDSHNGGNALPIIWGVRDACIVEKVMKFLNDDHERKRDVRRSTSNI